MRRSKWLVVSIWIPVGLLIAFGGLYLLLLCNPMLLGFLTSFEICNESGVDIWVTPIGAWQGSAGLYGPLPRYWNQSPPAIPSRQDHDIPIKTGERLEIIYDWDDINFRHLLVRVSSGEVYILIQIRKELSIIVMPLSNRVIAFQL